MTFVYLYDMLKSKGRQLYTKKEGKDMRPNLSDGEWKLMNRLWDKGRLTITRR